MRIAMIGTGYVGLVSGAAFSEFGVEVACVDKDVGKIARLRRGEIPIYEPGLDALVDSNVKAGRLSFSTDLPAAVRGADAVFIAVGTPSRRGDGYADLSYVYAAAEEIADALTGYCVIVVKSTVPVGTCREVERIIARRRPTADFDVASNPEFLREGSAINDFMRPDRVIIGAESDRAEQVLRGLYRPLYLIETPIIFTTLETAELTKYAANTFLATKITFINEIADLCPTSRTSRAASGSTVASGASSCTRGRAMAGRASPRTRSPSCAPRSTRARRSRSSKPSSR
jgi:UDPglucose 6-dehydrogenase